MMKQYPNRDGETDGSKKYYSWESLYYYNIKNLDTINYKVTNNLSQ